jgi:pimeloyl-ACP methyl ester carboxylesterase
MRGYAMIALAYALALTAATPAAPVPVPPAASVPTAAIIVGDWHGMLWSRSGQPIPIVVHVAGEPGYRTATFDSPSQKAFGVPITAVAEDGAHYRFVIALIDARFDATLAADGRSLGGTWSHGEGTQALNLARSQPGEASDTVPPRPQTPRPPFPYRAEEVGYDNVAGKAHLAGTLTLPIGHGAFPAVLLITGSGQEDRDETIFGHRPFAIWADVLTRRGIAVLRVDDRRMGGSTGEVRSATSADFAGDVAAGVAFLRSRGDIDPHRIALMGHSEGGLIAPLVASRDRAIAFIVLLAGPGLPGEEVMLEQKRLMERAAGVPAATVERANATMRGLYDAVKDAPDQTAADAALDAAWRRIAPTPDAPLPDGLRMIASPWMRWFARTDPRPILAQVDCPVLAVGGSLDLQVAAATNLAAIRAALHAHRDATVVELPGLNHLLQTARTGQVAEYARIEESIAPSAIGIVSDWIVAHAKP